MSVISDALRQAERDRRGIANNRPDFARELRTADLPKRTVSADDGIVEIVEAPEVHSRPGELRAARGVKIVATTGAIMILAMGAALYVSDGIPGSVEKLLTPPPEIAISSLDWVADVMFTPNPTGESIANQRVTVEPATITTMDETSTVVDLRERFQVSGVMVGRGSRCAVVNGAVVTVGQEIDGAMVVTIEPEHVRLKFDGRMVNVPLSSTAGKTLN